MFFDGADKHRGNSTGKVSACHQCLLKRYRGTKAKRATRTSHRATKWAKWHESTSHNDTLMQHAARSVRKTWRTAAAGAPVGLAEAEHNGRVSSESAPRPLLRADAQEEEGVVDLCDARSRGHGDIAWVTYQED